VNPDAEAIVVLDDGADPRSRISERHKAAAAASLVTAVLVAGAIAVLAWRGLPTDEPVATPTVTPNQDLTQLSDDAKWGHVWSLANGISVLRPTWLPAEVAGYSTGFSVDGGSDGLARYRFWYYANGRSSPGTVGSPGAPVRSIQLAAVRGGQVLRDVSLSTPPQMMIVRGNVAVLTGTASVPVWDLSWSDLGYAYDVQGVGYTSDELLRIVTSLREVIDDAGAVKP